MMLSDKDILKAIEEGEIEVIPFDEENLGPCSIDLTLSDSFRVFEDGDEVDSRSLAEENAHEVKTGGKPFTIQPHQFVLGKTRERIAISKSLSATLEGRSSIARFGLIVHAAGLVNPGTGLKEPVPQILEIFCQNNTSVKLYPGMKIIQMTFHRLDSPSNVGYDEREDSTFVGQK